jgi:hypothetical protein
VQFFLAQNKCGALYLAAAAAFGTALAAARARSAAMDVLYIETLLRV